MREWLKLCPVVAILRGIRTEEVEEVFGALHSAGIRIAEIPMNSPRPAESIRLAVELYGDRMLIGAGTVTSIEDVKVVQEAGGKLIVSPDAFSDVVNEAKRLDLIAVPGICNPTEAFAMLRAGADALKLFPADSVGPAMFHALRSVLPQGTAILPVGGVSVDTIESWQRLGADGYGVGSALYRPGRTPGEIQQIASQLVSKLQRRPL